MNTYLINYHSNVFKKNEILEKVLKDCSEDIIEVLPNSWILHTTTIAINLKNILERYIENNDILLISGINGESCGLGINSGLIRFIEKYT